VQPLTTSRIRRTGALILFAMPSPPQRGIELEAFASTTAWQSNLSGEREDRANLSSLHFLSSPSFNRNMSESTTHIDLSPLRCLNKDGSVHWRCSRGDAWGMGRKVGDQLSARSRVFTNTCHFTHRRLSSTLTRMRRNWYQRSSSTTGVGFARNIRKNTM